MRGRALARGGSYWNNHQNVRAAYRNHNEPDNFNNNIGFRVVARPHFSSPAGTAARAAMQIAAFATEAKKKNGGVRPWPCMRKRAWANNQTPWCLAQACTGALF
jgi:hypothetical protein